MSIVEPEAPPFRAQEEAAPKPRLVSFEVQNFRLFKKERLDVHPEVTVLVGRNDVGKSTLLSAVSMYGSLVWPEYLRWLILNAEGARFTAEWQVDNQRWTHSISLSADDPEERLEHAGNLWVWRPRAGRLEASNQEFHIKVPRYSSLANITAEQWRLDTDVPSAVYEAAYVTRQFRAPIPYLFEPSALSKLSPLQLKTAYPNGYGWSGWLQEIINRRNEEIGRLEAELKRLFPYFRSVRVRELDPRVAQLSLFQLSADVDRDDKVREVLVDIAPSTFAHQARGSVPASDVSAGLLLALAHLAFLYASEEGALLLLEEPENGLNAKITFEVIKAFLGVVRERHQQLIFTTHNEWWLDLVPPESIRVLTRDAEGAHVHTPAKEAIRKLLEDSELYPSEIMSTYGPEGFLFARPPAP
jgi:energy-coupling factor transporter ATP-binding protein EcfA2